MLNHLLDFIGTVLDLLVVLLFILASIIGWPVAMLATIVDAILFARTHLYADMLLQGIYFISMIYGWYYWLHGENQHQQATIKRLKFTMAVLLALISLCAISGLYLALQHFTNSTTPLLDATTTVLALVTQWLVCRKILENWLMWIVVDSLYLSLYNYKQLNFHALKNIIYLILAIIGFVKWYELYRQQSGPISRF